MTTVIDTTHALAMLQRWAVRAKRHWHTLPGRQDIGYYGSGYNEWGVQTNQKFAGAMAVLATLGDERARRWAQAALGFHAWSHLSGPGCCTDGTRWGHTWISTLGIERMMYGVVLLEPELGEAQRAELRGVALSEGQWLLEGYERYGLAGIRANLWDGSHENHPESNIWNGAFLWRLSVMFPDDPHVEAWREQAHRFLINGISVPADLEDERVVAGRPVRESCVGANFFPNYGQDHRGYMNLGYMLLCVSNVAMLHFDLRRRGTAAPESLYHHVAALWQVIRRMIFSNGRLADIGGDARVRYAYCHDYLLPALLFAADHLGDEHALGLAAEFLRLAAEEQDYGKDGSFYGRRLAHLEAGNPYYYTRLEADRAAGLAMLIAWAPLVRADAQTESGGTAGGDAASGHAAGDRLEFERSVSGSWCEPEHGSVLHRCPTRLASFAWRSFGLTQGLCLPPERGHLAEWDRNLAGSVQALHTPNPLARQSKPHRRLLEFSIREFEGGFLTWGSVMEGVDVEIDGGWQGTDSAVHRIVFAALPDGHTVVGLEHCRTGARYAYMYEEQGLHLNLPNDLYNAHRRVLAVEGGQHVLESPPGREEVVVLGSRWLNLEDCLGVVGLYGADSLSVVRHGVRRGGPLRSLWVEEIAWYARRGAVQVRPDTVVLDVGWLVVSSLDARGTRACADQHRQARIELGSADLRAVGIQGRDGRTYLVLANFSSQSRVAALPAAAGVGTAETAGWIDLATGEPWPAVSGDRVGKLTLAGGEARVIRIEQTRRSS